MKINSEKLFEFVNNLGTDEKVTFKVFEDDNYVTEIYWDGENFQWEPGTFTSGMLFDPLVDFVEIKEDGLKKLQLDETVDILSNDYDMSKHAIHKCIIGINVKINEIIDKLNSMEVK